MPKHMLGILGILLLAISVTSCDFLSNQKSPEIPVDDEVVQALSSVDWELFAWGAPNSLQPVLDGSAITLSLIPEGDGSRGQLNGSAGCNTYGSSYELTATSFSVSEVLLTRMFCMAPEGVMDQENSFVDALRRVTSFELNGGQLDLFYGGGGERLFFIASQL